MDASTALLCHKRGLLTADETLSRVLLDGCKSALDAVTLYTLLAENGHKSIASQVQQEYSRRATTEMFV